MRTLTTERTTPPMEKAEISSQRPASSGPVSRRRGRPQHKYTLRERWDEELLAQLLAMRRQGKTYKQMAEHFGCSASTLQHKVYEHCSNDLALSQRPGMVQRRSHKWTTEEDQVLIRHFDENKTVTDAAKALPGRTGKACEARRHQLITMNIIKNRCITHNYTAEDDEMLRSLNDQGLSPEHMSVVLKRSALGLRRRLEVLGIRLKFAAKRKRWSDKESSILRQAVERQLTVAQTQALLPGRSVKSISVYITRTKKKQGMRLRDRRVWSAEETEELKKAHSRVRTGRATLHIGSENEDIVTIENIASKMGISLVACNSKLSKLFGKKVLVPKHSQINFTKDDDRNLHQLHKQNLPVAQMSQSM